MRFLKARVKHELNVTVVNDLEGRASILLSFCLIGSTDREDDTMDIVDADESDIECMCFNYVKGLWN